MNASMTFSKMNPEFSGCYLAVADDDLRTAKLFDTKHEMYGWIRDMIEVEGYECITTTILGSNGEVDGRLMTKVARYFADEDCYKWGPIEPVISTNIRVVYEQEISYA